jgi:uncharacterized protein (UPF0548 family)
LFRFTAPLDDEVRRFIANQEHAGFAYSEVGASADTVPDGYNVDHNRIELGRGERVWQRTVAAVGAWQMFNIPWLRLYWPDTPIEVGAIVAISVCHFGFFSLNACRIVYVVDEDGVVTNAPVSRFGFANGTLGEHAESGEERFTVEWDRTSDNVFYDILAFSRPRHTLAKLTYPLSRSLQRAFADCSKVTMSNAVTEGLR